MAKYFYSDCVISDVRGNAAGLVSAKIDGREMSNIDMKPEIYRYFTGVGAGTKIGFGFPCRTFCIKNW